MRYCMCMEMYDVAGLLQTSQASRRYHHPLNRKWAPCVLSTSVDHLSAGCSGSIGRAPAGKNYRPEVYRPLLVPLTKHPRIFSFGVIDPLASEKHCHSPGGPVEGLRSALPYVCTDCGPELLHRHQHLSTGRRAARPREVPQRGTWYDRWG